ncbi:MAG: winged helix-turn-helix transcriptional regulator [Acidithiobacillus sp.]
MLLILIKYIALHAVHVLRTVMLAQTRTPLCRSWAGSPQGPRILLLVNARTNGKTVVSVEVALERAGGQVRRVMERLEAEQLMRRWDPEVFVLLGWSATTGDWLQSLQFVPHQDALPFLVVDNGAEEDHQEPNAVAALEVGAQAYISASLGLEILTAQVRGLLKKLRTHASAQVGEGENLCIDLVSLRVWILGQEIHLPRRLFYLLHYFATHPDEVVSNDQIADILWGGKGTYFAPNTLAVKIYRLRKILESAGAKGWLETVRSFGYRFSPPSNT